MDAFDVTHWGQLFSALVAASAALTGLVFVSISINLDRILALGGLPDRALEAILLLAGIPVLSLWKLIPGQAIAVLVTEVLVSATVLAVLMVVIQTRVLRRVDRTYRAQNILITVLVGLAMLSFVFAGLSLLLQAGGGIYWLVPGMVLSFATAILDAWVLLVEIRR